jgi:hypothetical protein
VGNLPHLDALRRRDLLGNPKADQRLLAAYGRLFFDGESYYDAFQFFARGRDAEGLRDCKRVALETGDHELLWLAAHCPDLTVSEDDWRACAAKAAEMGKLSVAAHIYLRIGDAKALESLPREEASRPTTAGPSGDK